MNKNTIKMLVGILLTGIILSFGIQSAEAETITDSLYVDKNYEYWVVTHPFDSDTPVTAIEWPVRRISDNKLVYCIQAHIKFNDANVIGLGDENEQLKITDLSESDLNKIKLIAYYGHGYGNHTSMEWYVATQLLIWDITDPNDPVYPSDGMGHFERSTRYDAMQNEILSLVNDHKTQPSFNNQTLTMKIGETITLQDTNNVLSNYMVSSDENFDVSITGNKLIITAKKGFEGNINIFQKERELPLIYDGANQLCLSRGTPFFSETNLNINVTTEFEINKYYGDKNDGIYKLEENSEFEVYNNDTKELITTLKTDEFGKASVQLNFGNYLVHQTIGITGYEYVKDYTFTVDGTSMKEVVLFQNERITSELDFTKVDKITGKVLENALIEVYNAETNELVYSGRTNVNGKINLKTLGYGKYYIIEKEAPNGYKLNNEKAFFEVTKSGEIIRVLLTNEEIKVPDTDITDYYLQEIIGALIILMGIGIVIYVKKKKNK